jgi:hypothetical protein
MTLRAGLAESFIRACRDAVWRDLLRGGRRRADHSCRERDHVGVDLESADVDAFRRFQSAVPNRRGRFPGVFALANGLARDGRLSPSDDAWWATTNERCEELYTDPSTIDPACYDEALNPGAAAWFKGSATELLAVTSNYLALLDRYAVAWMELRTAAPGHIIYEDETQVVAVPYTVADWPFPEPRAGKALAL